MCTRHVTQSQLIEKNLQAIKLVWPNIKKKFTWSWKGEPWIWILVSTLQVVESKISGIMPHYRKIICGQEF